MPYCICNDKEYLIFGNGKKQLTTNPNYATKWDKISKANNVVSTLPKVYSTSNLEVRYVGHTGTPTKEVELEYDILEKIKDIQNFAENLESRKEYLNEQLSLLDLKIVDIQHYAEFNNLNASQGYKLYKLLHETTLQRRKVKDELQTISLSLSTSINSRNMENLTKSITGLETQKYTPRVFKELFGE